MFLRDYWYAAGFSEEVGRDFLARTYLNEDVVIFRKEDGTPVALENRCAHRRLPLSMGKLIGDTLECGYHGLLYDCEGVVHQDSGAGPHPQGNRGQVLPNRRPSPLPVDLDGRPRARRRVEDPEFRLD